MKTRPCKFGKVKSGARKGRCRTRPQRRRPGSKYPASMLYGLGGVTKQDFIAIGTILCRNQAAPKLVEDLAQYFREQNPAFNPHRFVAHVAKCKR